MEYILMEDQFEFAAYKLKRRATTYSKHLYAQRQTTYKNLEADEKNYTSP